MGGTAGNKHLPLEGLRVVDLTRLLPGPLCTMLMADYGADVIKVEDVEAGDPTRFVGRFYAGSGSFFRQLNRNKRSLAVNLKADRGRDLIKKLAAESDVLIEGFRPGVMERLGLDYEKLRPINRGLIYASLSGYGQTGPYRDRAGHDINYTALVGMLGLSAEEDGPPVMPAVQVADIAGGSLMALSGIMMALYQRRSLGEGRFVDISMTRGLLPWLAYHASGLDDEEGPPRRNHGYITGAFACYNIYETADGKYMSLGALEPVFWKRFCEAVGRSEWVEHQFEKQGREQLIKEVSLLFKTKTREQWEVFFEKIDACCEPVLGLSEAIEHPISRSGKYWLDLPLDDDNSEKVTGFPLFFSGQAGALRLPPPKHGEHTEEVLEALGLSEAEIKKLDAARIIKTSG